jgi:hypothetical protein
VLRDWVRSYCWSGLGNRSAVVETESQGHQRVPSPPWPKAPLTEASAFPRASPELPAVVPRETVGKRGEFSVNLVS